MSFWTRNPMKWLQDFVTEVSSHEMRAALGTTWEIPDSVLQLSDGDDTTSTAVFDLSGVSASTEVTIPVTDAGLTLSGLTPVVDTGGAFATPIELTAADSGNVYPLDDAAGLDFTLPAITAANVGMTFGFRIVVEPTSNSYRWTAQAADLLIGNVVIFDKDVAEGSTEALLQIMRPDNSDDLICTITGTDDTQGSLVGGWIEFEAITATNWFVRGSLVGDGALAQIFS
jgi:hypothetical protein